MTDPRFHPQIVEINPTLNSASDTLYIKAPASKTMYYRLAGILLSWRGCILGIPDCEDADAVTDILLAAGGVVVSDGRVCLDYFRESKIYEVDVKCSGGALRVTLPALLASLPLGAVLKARMCNRLVERLEEGTRQLLSLLGEWMIVKQPGHSMLVFKRTHIPTTLRIESEWSSQPVSGALLAATVISALLGTEVRFELITRVSSGHLMETLEALRLAGVNVRYELQETRKGLMVTGFVKATQRRYVLRVPGDWGLASLLLPLATRYKVLIEGLWTPWPGPGDHLASFYASVLGYHSYILHGNNSSTWIVEADGSRSHTPDVEIDMRNTPDIAVSMAYATIAIEGKARLKGVEHLTLKESDRLSTVAESIRACGGIAYNARDSLVIMGKCLRHYLEYTCPEDHRIAMGLAALALASGIHIKIRKAYCVQKSWRNFWSIISELGIATLRSY